MKRVFPHLIAAAFLGLLLTGGCGCNRTAEPSVTAISDLEIDSLEELDPMVIDKDAKVTIAGTSRPMELRTNKAGEIFLVELLQHGEVDDREEYRVSEGFFSLHEAAGENFSPPIPLLKFPMSVGENWEWKGRSVAGKEDTQVKAKVTTSEEAVSTCAGSIASVKTRVQLVYAVNKDLTIKREMTFYFAPDMGLFKRSFGSSSVREPDCR